MADVRQSWNEAGERLNALGLKLKLHYEQQRDEGEQAKVAEAVKRLADTVEGAFDALGAASKDPAVKDDIKQVGQSVTGALRTTFSEASDEIRKLLKRPGG